MIEYIDKHATAEHIDMYAKLLTIGDYRSGMIKAKEILLAQESEDIAPTAPKMVRGADVVPVVRCKDCKYWNNGNVIIGCYWDVDYPHEENDFCSHGERREE